jgi:hypothetical protein
MQPNSCSIRKIKQDMTPKSEKSEKRQPPEMDAIAILWPALEVGGVSGM